MGWVDEDLENKGSTQSESFRVDLGPRQNLNQLCEMEEEFG